MIFTVVFCAEVLFRRLMIVFLIWSEQYFGSNSLTSGVASKTKCTTTFYGYGTWKITKGFVLAAGVRNMLDRNSPLSFRTQTFQAGCYPRFTDPTGRTFYLRGT
ncbi:MAG: outer membrane receptor protein involved in Fe transport [Janthinobacterium sp.]|jgi:outer membrane receptor protein involved in Fe transport